MRVLFVVGSYPPDICGVGDYTSCLVSALKQQGIDAQVITGQDWRFIAISKLLKRIDSYNADIIHIQYPTYGFHKYLGPQLLSILRSCVTTIHEVSQVHILRQLSLYGFSMRARKIIFTTEGEKRFAELWCPWISYKSSLIPIGVNIPLAENFPRILTKDIIGYFGLIRPEKGLDQVIELASILREKESRFSIRIMGKVVQGRESYYSSLLALSKGLHIEWCIDVDDQSLANLIASCKFAYLPFPDGVSERRSTALTFMRAGVGIITTRGSQTPRYMDQAMCFALNPEEAFKIIDELSSRPDKLQNLQRHAKELSQRYTWENIAREHIMLYSELI